MLFVHGFVPFTTITPTRTYRQLARPVRELYLTGSKDTGHHIRLSLFLQPEDNNDEQDDIKPASTTSSSSSSSGSPAPYFPQSTENENKNTLDDESLLETTRQGFEKSVSDTSSSSHPTTTANSNSSSNTIRSKIGTILSLVMNQMDSVGVLLKPKAILYLNKAEQISTIKQQQLLKWRYLFQSCLFYSLYIFYRGYRGFFVLLPKVFQETFYKLETSIAHTPFEVDDDNKQTTGLAKSYLDSTSRTNIAIWRTKITVSILSFIVVSMYVVSGIGRVMARMVSTMIRTSKSMSTTSSSTNNNDKNTDIGFIVSKSFAAAADEQERNEQVLYQNLVKSSLYDQNEDWKLDRNYFSTKQVVRDYAQNPSTTTSSPINGEEEEFE